MARAQELREIEIDEPSPETSLKQLRQNLNRLRRDARKLDQAGIEHQVHNANHIAAEADIVARAGRKGHVTVATNMAGRGTDIKLGPGVHEMGGLYVICTELHDSARIDRTPL